MVVRMKLPHKISYTNSVKGGDSKLWFIRINPKHQYDTGLHAHEYEHVVQWHKMTLMFTVLVLGLSAIYSQELLYLMPLVILPHGLAYTYITKYRQYCEVKAFKKLLKHNTNEGDLDFFAEYLASNYNLSLRVEEAKKLLSE